MRIDVLLPASSVSPLMPGVGTVLLIATLLLLPAAIVYVWTALALGRVFGKLGIEEWKAWVPFYNMAVVLGLGGFSGWLLLLLLIPVFGPVFVYVATVTAAHRIGAMFGVGTGMTVLAALLFPVWASVLGFGSARALPLPERPSPHRGQDADAVYRSLFPDLEPDPAPAVDRVNERAPREGRVMSAPDEDVFVSRRDVAAPSAWIPPATATSVPPAEPPTVSAAPPTVSAPVAPPASAPMTLDSAPPTPVSASPAASPTTEPAPPAPAPVTSWWQPAEPAEPEESALPWNPPAPEPAPAPVPTSAPQPPATPTPPAPPAEPAPPAPVSRAVLREAYLVEEDAFEDSGEVSAVAGSPAAGPPRSAAAAVSAARSGVGELIEDTVIASRRSPRWMLHLPDGTSVDLNADSVVLGRRPERVAAAPGAQLIAVVDETRTVSKTHALLRRRADAWLISDLASTNGVVVFQASEEIEVAAGGDAEVVDRFLLGDAELRIARRELV